MYQREVRAKIQTAGFLGLHNNDPHTQKKFEPIMKKMQQEWSIFYHCHVWTILMDFITRLWTGDKTAYFLHDYINLKLMFTKNLHEAREVLVCGHIGHSDK